MPVRAGKNARPRGALDMKLLPRIAQAAGAFIIAHTLVPAHANEPPAPRVITLNIKGQPIGDALSELARQSGLQIVLYTEVGRGVSGPRLIGRYTAQGALDKLLDGTSLGY